MWREIKAQRNKSIPSAYWVNGEWGVNYTQGCTQLWQEGRERWGRAKEARVNGALGKGSARMRATTPAHQPARADS